MATTYDGPERRMHTRVGWRSGTAGMILGRLWSLIAYSDTTPTRFMLAGAGMMWGFFLFLPGATFDRPVYRYMAMLAGETHWAALWLTYSLLMWWRIFSASNAHLWSLVINILGAMLYTTTSVSIYLTLTYPFPAAIATELILALAAGWVLVRTNINPEGGWRRD